MLKDRGNLSIARITQRTLISIMFHPTESSPFRAEIRRENVQFRFARPHGEKRTVSIKKSVCLRLSPAIAHKKSEYLGQLGCTVRFILLKTKQESNILVKKNWFKNQIHFLKRPEIISINSVAKCFIVQSSTMLSTPGKSFAVLQNSTQNCSPTMQHINKKSLPNA